MAPGQTVVFTAASAGALAPLSGQVLNLRSNFDNIGDQKLNIVLGAGAAAYNLASGQCRIGDGGQPARERHELGSTLNVTNTATGPAGFVENLNAAVGSVNGPVQGSGSVNNLLAGSSAAAASTSA